MSEVDGLGEMVTGAALAAAVEPTAGGEAERRDGACLNCSTPLIGPYCAACGQKARVHRSLRTFFGDLVQGLFNFEGKIWRTLPLLAWRPGEMTRRYVEGERARFVSPVALYLFTVFAMFAVLNFTGTMDPSAVGDSDNFGVAEERAELKRLEDERATAPARRAGIAEIDRRIATKKEEIGQLEMMERGEWVKLDGNENDEAAKWLSEAATKIDGNPGAFSAKVQDAASKFSWLLIPLSVPFLWLLFPLSRRYHLYDHMVFVTYSLSFMMMLVVAGGVLVSIGAPSLASMLFFVPPLHMFRQLKGAYGLSRLGALWRTVALVSFAFVASILFFLAILGIGIL